PHGRGSHSSASGGGAMDRYTAAGRDTLHMLVLSRRLDEKILFPSINTAVKVIAIKHGLVRLGIEAPPEVLVLREELQGRMPEGALAAASSAEHGARPEVRELTHLLRNRLNIASVGLAVLNQ